MKKFKKLLLAAKEKLEAEIQQLQRDNLNRSQRDSSGDLSGYSYHMADVGTDTFGREVELTIASAGSETMKLIDEALERIEDGTYGKCQICGCQVDMKRLEAVPYAHLCISCQSEEERNG
ncbi:MAG: TraR/DksA C4-type zinc finger protein [Candidatus Hydrogenedentes bacterium]|nr:TraR/DksA C4-type zinc finger protein [Candidatus Hydrogenedentota bacterium]